MLFKDIGLLDENLVYGTHMFVGVLDGRIDYIGPEMPDAPEKYGEIYDGKNRLLMSGFFNAHAHTPMTLLRGYGENMVLSDWLNKRIFPFEAKMTGEDIYYGMLLGIAEMLQTGTVSATDMYYHGREMAEAVLESGFKSNIGLPVVCFTDEDFCDLPIYDEVRSVFGQYHNADGERLKIDMSVHAEYTSTPKVVSQAAAFCKSIGANMHIHLSETADEHEACRERHGGLTPAAYFDSLGLFDNPTTAAHCVWLDDADMAVLKEKSVTVAACPVSNMKLASGVSNVSKLLEKGVNVAIGTDSAASNNNLNMIEEMKFFALIGKSRFGDPTLVTPKEAVTAATVSGARSQGRYDTGKLCVGYRADLIVLRTDLPSMQPCHDMLNNIVYAAGSREVCLTMVDGRVLYRDGAFPTIDIEKVTEKVNAAVERILSES